MIMGVSVISLPCTSAVKDTFQTDRMRGRCLYKSLRVQHWVFEVQGATW